MKLKTILFLNHPRKRWLLVVALFFSTVSWTQPFNMNDNINPIELIFHKYNPEKQPNAKGRINITEITQIKDTLYFFAKGMSIYSPIFVSVDSEDHSNKIKTGIYKMSWSAPNLNGKTDRKGHWDTHFKTEMDFGIMIVPKNTPAKYTLLVWSGDEAKIELPTTFKKDSGSKGGGFSTITLLYVFIGIMALFMIYMFIKLQKKKK